MTTTIKGNLVMNKDMVYEGGLIVKGDIFGKDGIRHNLTVYGNITSGDIFAKDIIAVDINSGNIDAEDMDVNNITARDIDAINIDARNINAGDINAKNIKAEDIDVMNINAENVIYYAVCFAYNNIKCKSIKGKKANSKHFVLDGKIEIIK